jgi:nicotinate dehydrogenase subunit B
VTTRRAFLQSSGALVLAFSLRAVAQEEGGKKDDKLPGSLGKAPFLDAWIRIDANNAVTIFTGKVELGQGVKTALLQVAAEELDVEAGRVKIITADTAATPDEGFTAGSNSLKDSGTALRLAAAQVRALLVAKASERLGVAAASLSVRDGVIEGGGKRVTYGELVAGQELHVEAQPTATLKDPKQYRIVGKRMARLDIPAKVTGGAAYVHDIRLPGMLHARVVPPPSYNAELASLDTAAAEKLPGVKVLRDGNFVAVVAEREWTAVKAMRLLAANARWNERAALPDMARLSEAVLALPSEDVALVERPGTPGVKTLEATYTRHYQMHASIGPSCAVAHLDNGQLTVWSHTQGVYPDRTAIAEMLGMPEDKVRVVHAEGSGCYGHNGADDAAADAALIATLVPGKPIRVQWMREHEHAWEPYGPAMVSKVRASIDGTGRIVDWDYGVWSNTHSTRPGNAGSLLAARHSSRGFTPEVPKVRKSPEGLGDRNAIPLYTIAGMRVVHHFLAEMPLRVSALRSLGAYHNVFAIESFMDELAAAAGKDPVQFRMDHLGDGRAREVVRLAAEKFGWNPAAPKAGARGRGFAFARYKNLAAYCAVAVEVTVDAARSRVRLVRAVAAVDSGQVVNPDGLRNQIEGAIIQSASWTLHEKVRFDRTRIRSLDWSTYPILRFDGVPDAIEVHIIDRPGLPFLGSGETGQGPAAAAIANAVAHATGQRLRHIPLRA